MATGREDRTVMETETKIRALTSSTNIREDMALVMEPHANWEEYLMPAPLSIALLGQLMGISTKSDFSLETSKPKDGFKYITNPKSFRACLQQVANCGCEAFSRAQTNMDAIRLMTARVPEQMKDSLDILYKESNEDIKHYLPIYLGRIKKTADESLKLAKDVEKKFDDVMSLTGEILMASEEAEGSYEDKMKETEIQKCQASKRKEAIDQEKQRNDELFQQISESFKKSEESYYKSMNELPGGFKLLGMQVLEDTFQATSGLIGLIGFGTAKKLTQGAHVLHSVAAYGSLHAGNIKNLGRNITSTVSDDNTNSAESSHQQDPVQESITLDGYQAYVKCFQLNEPTMGLMMFVQKNTIVIPAGCDQDDPVKALMIFKNRFNTMLLDLQLLGDSEPKKRIQVTCKGGNQLCDELIEVFKSFRGADDQTKMYLAERIQDLDGRVKEIITEANIMLKTPPLQNKARGQAKQAKNSPNMSAKDYAVQQAKYKLDNATQHLEHTRSMYAKVCDDRKKVAEEMKDLILEMGKLDIEKVDFETRRKTLKKGIRAFQELREKWSKLVTFFQMISKLIDKCLNDYLQDFVQLTDTAGSRSLDGYPPNERIKDNIYKAAFEGAKIAYLVNMISETYVVISQKHLTHRIAGVGKIMGYDYKKHSGKIKQEMKQLKDDCQAAHDDIQREIENRKQLFHRKVDKRLAELEKAKPVIDDVSAACIERATTNARKRAEKLDPIPTVHVLSSDDEDMDYYA